MVVKDYFFFLLFVGLCSTLEALINIEIYPPTRTAINTTKYITIEICLKNVIPSKT